MTGRLEGRVALITGASRGLGAAVAERYAREGAHVVLVARTEGGLKETDDRVHAAGGSATLVPMDLRDGAAIDRLGGAVAERWRKLDILVANAALLGQVGPLGQVPPESWQEVFAVNVEACWRLVRSFDALLRASDAGRAIFVSSSASRSLRAYWGLYAASKAALEAMTVCYARELEKTTVRANVISPGPMRTAMRARAMPGEDPESVTPPEALTGRFVDLAEPSWEGNGEIIELTG